MDKLRRRVVWVGFALVLAACGEEDDSGDSDAAETEAASMTGQPASDSEDPGDSADPGESEDSGDSEPSQTSGPSSDSNDGSASCDGDWYLGSVPFTGDAFIEACDADPPTICITGNYIVFGDGECFCLPECSRAGLSEGDACTDDGSVTCTRIENDSGESSGVFCVPEQWGLCGA